MKSNNRLESAGLCTHVGELLCVQRRCGMICFSKFFKFCAAAFFAIFCGLFCHIDSAYAVDYPFSVTTSSISSGGTFQFKMSAQGTFYVDCGTGGTLSGTGVSGNTITKSNTTEYTYTCTYSSTGTKTIRFGGTATGYNTNYFTPAINFNITGNIHDSNAVLITSISGNLSTIFPNNGTALGSHPVFASTFLYATNLTSIPATLFSGYTSGGSYMFQGTFSYCTGLTSVPETLFDFGGNSVSGQDYMFASTFYGCTGLTSVPANLFQRVTSSASFMFMGTFYGCTNITGYIPPSTFAGLIANGSPTANNMWSNPFGGTQLVTSCPTGTTQYITGYESAWNGKVSCRPNNSFSLTTGNIAANGTFQFKISAQGTFYVDCGTGGTLSGTGVSGNMILKSNTTNYTYTCTYSSAGSKTIRFGGAANGYNSGGTISFYTSAANAALIASVSGDLTSIFPYIGSSSGQYPSFAGTFSECTSLTSIPENLFNFSGNNVSGQDGMFSNTFSGCTGLTSIPANLFQRVTSGAEYLFYGTFWGCSGLTEIPSNLFNFGGNSVSGQRYMFAATFVGCTGLTSIPTNLFQRVTSGAQYLFQITFWGCTGLTSIPGNLFNFGGNNVSGQISMFDGTFKGCIGLTSIPGDLFQRITSGARGLFVSTFNGCTGLTSIPDTLFDFGGNNVSGQPNMFTYAFRDCVGLTSIPVNLFQRITSSAESLFLGTFSGCISIAGYIPPSTFAGLIANNHPTANYMWYDTFADTQLVTTCPADTSQYTTGYEGSNANTTWNGKVSCETVAYNVSYACGMGGGNPPSSTTATYNLPFTPAANTCTVPDGTFSGWLVSGTSDVKPAGTAFTWNYTEGKTLTAQYTWNTHTVTYSCGEGSGNPPSSTTATYNSLFTFAANTCTPPSGKVFVSWVLSDTYDVYSPGTTILWQYTENKTVTAQYASDGESFSITTSSIGANGTFQFKLSAKGTFVVNCGNGGTLSGTGVSGNTITKSSTTEYTYTCTYSSAGEKTISFGGSGATDYNTGFHKPAITFNTSNANSALIAEVHGNLSELFPYISSSSGKYPVFYQTFNKCTRLKYLPDTLFADYTTTGEGMFYNTFTASGLRALPEHLFSNITTNANNAFNGTFSQCSSLSGYIPPTLFSGLIANGSPGSMMSTFNLCYVLLTSCPEGTAQYITGYESGWNSHVSCEPAYTVTYSCGDGGGTAPAIATVTNNSSFTPATNTCTVPTGYTFGGWLVSGTSDVKPSGTAFAWNYDTDKTLTAQYTGNTYNVTYACGVGGGTAPSGTSATYGSSFTPALNTCNVPTGYSFSRWRVSGTNDVKLQGSAFTWNYTEDKTFTAEYSARGFQVMYSCGSGTGDAPDFTTAIYDSSFTPATNTCNVPAGYTFSGWLVSGTSDVRPAGTEFTWNYTSTKTLTAQYTANTYPVSYACGSGGGNAPSNTTATYDSSFTPAANTCTVPTGHTFSGWLISDTNVVKPAGTAFTWTYAGKTLTAQYTANTYTITVTAGRGVSALSATGWTNTNTTTITKTLTYNDTVDLSTITATMKDGYTGKAYAISSGAGTLSGASFTVGAGVTTISISATGITTPTASLTSTDTITDTYNAPGSVTITANSVTGYDSGITITYSFGIATYSSSSGCAAFSYGTAGSTNSTTMAKTNHRGYRCVNVKVVASDGTLTSQEAISTHRLVYLVQRRLRFYEDSEYTSKYARYGTQLLYTSATNNTTTSVPTLAAREGYTFNGWWTAATGGSQVIDANGTIKPSISGYTDASSNYILTANKAVYARFVANTISLTWDGASGTPTSCTYGSTFVPPTPEPRVGYVFSGWKVKTTNP